MRTVSNVSVVIPCYYSEKTIGDVVAQTRSVLEDSGYVPDFVLVNDGSTDGTFSEIQKLACKGERVRGVDLTRNFGQHRAILTGLQYATGDAVIVMDDDLQTHPSQTLKLLSKLEEGYDLVFALYESVRQTWYRRVCSKAAQRIACFLTKRPSKLYVGSFYAARRSVYLPVSQFAGYDVNVQATFFMATRNVANVTVEHHERAIGSSGYTLGKLMRVWSAQLGYTRLPASLCALSSAALALASVILFVIAITSASILLACTGAAIMAISILLACLSLVAFQVTQALFTLTRMPSGCVRSTVASMPESR